MVNKVRNKISRWKGKQFSFVGQVCLLKSVISALPLYFLSFKAPNILCKELIKIQGTSYGVRVLRIER